MAKAQATKEAPAQEASDGQGKALTTKERKAMLEGALARIRSVEAPVQVQRQTPATEPSVYVQHVADAYTQGLWVQVEAGSELEARVIMRELRKALRQLNDANGTDIRFTENVGTADGVWVVQVKPRDKQDGKGRPKKVS